MPVERVKRRAHTEHVQRAREAQRDGEKQPQRARDRENAIFDTVNVNFNV